MYIQKKKIVTIEVIYFHISHSQLYIRTLYHNFA